MRRIAVVAVLSFTLLGCTNGAKYEQVHTPDGRTIDCVRNNGSMGGISCNWPGTKP